MFSKLVRNLFLFDMPEKYKSGFTLSLRQSNSERLLVFCVFITAAQLFLIINDIIIDPQTFFNNDIWLLWIFKLAFLLISMLVFILRLRSDKQPSTFMGLCNYYFVVIYIFIQLILARYELHTEKAIYSFAYVAILIGVVPIFDILESATVSFTYMIIMLLQIYLVKPDNNYMINSVIFVVCFSLMSFVASRLTYATFARNYVSEKTATEKKEMVESRADELEVLSNTDQLTSILNRRGFEQVFVQYWNQCADEQKLIAVMMVDIDKFKQYNDNYGHPEGDKCLIAVAETLKRSFMRKDDLFARYGGEEFLAAMPFTDMERACKQAERLRQMVSDLGIKHEYSGIEPYVTVSTGVAGIIPSPGDSPETLIKMADMACYKAKNNGRNRVEVYNDETV